jgi:glycosyltransferase involved in cell wall biosynthesis
VTRVFHAMAGAAHGGAEAFFTRLLPALARAGVEQRAAIRPDTAREAALTAAGIETGLLPFGGWLDFRTKGALEHQVGDFAPDILLAWMNRAAAALPEGPQVNVGRLGGYYDLKYYRRCAHLIANTEDIRAYLINSGWPAEKCYYLPNFVDGAPGTAIARAPFDTPDGAPLALALGRLHENKAFDVLIEAAAGIPDLHVWIAGEGPLEDKLKSQARDAGAAEQVHFLGWRDDSADLLATCDFLVCPSRHEPLGNVVIEAWAQKRPVIAAESQGPVALIENNETGLLFPIDDAETLRKVMLQLISDRPFGEVLAEGGYNAYQGRFTEARVVARYCEFFDMVKR